MGSGFRAWGSGLGAQRVEDAWRFGIWLRDWGLGSGIEVNASELGVLIPKTTHDLNFGELWELEPGPGRLESGFHRVLHLSSKHYEP